MPRGADVRASIDAAIRHIDARIAGKLIGTSGRLQGSLAMPYAPPFEVLKARIRGAEASWHIPCVSANSAAERVDLGQRRSGMLSSPIPLCFLAVLSLLGFCASAGAQQVPGLALDVPPACRSEAMALSERELPAALRADHARLSVELVGDRYRATVHTTLGARTLEGENCAAAVSAGLVFVALSIAEESPSVPVQTGATGLASTPQGPSASALTAPRRARADSEGARREGPSSPATRLGKPLTVRATGLALWGTGALPGAGFGGGFSASAGKGMWHGAAGFSGWGEREVAAPMAGAGGRFWLWSGLAAACVGRPRGRLRPGGCLGAELGRMHGEGTGVTRSEHARVLWAAPIVTINRGEVAPATVVTPRSARQRAVVPPRSARQRAAARPPGPCGGGGRKRPAGRAGGPSVHWLRCSDYRLRRCGRGFKLLAALLHEEPVNFEAIAGEEPAQ